MPTTDAQTLDVNNDANRRIAFITGGAGGLGLETGRRLANDGLRIVLADLNHDAVRAAAKSLPGSGHMGVKIDVGSEESIIASFQAVERNLGPIAVLGTFAGVVGNDEHGTQPSLWETTLELWNRTFAINATGTFLCLREYARQRLLRPIEHGRVITISSAGAQLGGYLSKSPYVASKGAVLSLTKAAARDLAPMGITVNCIAPGRIETPMLRAAQEANSSDKSSANDMPSVPLRRNGFPQEIAAAFSYLASIDAAFVTGSTIDVNGGSRMQ